MRNIITLSVLVGLLFVSCEEKKSLCNEAGSIDALKVNLIESLKKQSEYITEKYGVENVDSLLSSDLFENMKVSNPYLQEVVSSDKTEETCTCGTSISFANNEAFIEFIKPIVLSQMENKDKYSSEYIRNEHLIKFFDRKEYSFFFAVTKNESGVWAFPIGDTPSSLLMEYMNFSTSP